MKSGTCFPRAGLVAASVVLALAGAPRAALAIEDDGKASILQSMIDLVMPGDQPIEGNIQYRERAPIVVPANRNALPDPQAPVAKRAKAWPKDQEIARREAEQAAKAKPRVDEVWEPVNRRELDRVRTTNVQGPGSDKDCNEPLGRPCNQEAFWGGLRNAKSAGADDKSVLTVGKEPPRAALTEPPAGYRKPTTAQKYTFEVRKDDDIADARAQAIEDARRRSDR